jgi:NAD(P)-dependent dehydrogenase (short-subunit alcohol dehydrogenase family)
MRGQRALITGGTGALGAAVTRSILARGTRVTVTYLDEAERKALEGTLPSGAAIDFVNVDATDEPAVQALVEKLGTLEILTHLIGGFAAGPTANFSLSAYRHQLDVNLTSAFVTCKAALSSMQRTGYGRIVCVGAHTAIEGGGGAVAYAAAKAGVIALTRAIAEETRNSDITANSVVPTIIDTPANRAAFPTADRSNWSTPESIASIICFLGSKTAGHLRGAALPV